MFDGHSQHPKLWSDPQEERSPSPRLATHGPVMGQRPRSRPPTFHPRFLSSILRPMPVLTHGQSQSAMRQPIQRHTSNSSASLFFWTLDPWTWGEISHSIRLMVQLFYSPNASQGGISAHLFWEWYLWHLGSDTFQISPLQPPSGLQRRRHQHQRLLQWIIRFTGKQDKIRKVCGVLSFPWSSFPRLSLISCHFVRLLVKS